MGYPGTELDSQKKNLEILPPPKPAVTWLKGIQGVIQG